MALPGCNGTDEDVLTYAMFPQVAPKFFTERAEGPKNVGKDPAECRAPPNCATAGQGVRARARSTTRYEPRRQDKHTVSVERA